MNFHALLLYDGTIQVSLEKGTDGKSCLNFVENTVDLVRGVTVCHDGLRSNIMDMVQDAWKKKGAKPVTMPPSSCDLSPIETVFGIVKSKY